MAKKEKRPNDFVLGPRSRASYVHLWEKYIGPNGKPCYSCTFLIPKDDKKTVKAIKAAIKAAYDAGQSKLEGANKKVPPLSSLPDPLRDGDAKFAENGQEEYKGCYYINVKNYNHRPGLFDNEGDVITDPEEIYSGMYAKAFCSAYAYNNSGSKGIAFSVEHVMKVADGERFGGHSISFEDAFAEDDDDEEEDDFLD